MLGTSNLHRFLSHATGTEPAVLPVLRGATAGGAHSARGLAFRRDTESGARFGDGSRNRTSWVFHPSPTFEKERC